MQSPFIKASCGCIVIPLHQDSVRIKGSMDCILIRACDNGSEEGEWCFHIRSMETHKVVVDPTYDYEKHGSNIPHPLDEEKTIIVMENIGRLIAMAYDAQNIQWALSSIGCLSKELKSF